MPSIRKILFPVDFSDRCRGAARYVEALAGRFQAELLLLHVVTNQPHTLAEELYESRKPQLDGFLKDELKYFNVQRHCVMGDPAEQIVEAAEVWAPDLIMMPTYGLGFFRALLLGSVTAKVLHDVTCPVWTDVHSEDAPPLEAVTLRRILCAVDLEDHSRCVLQWGAFLAAEYQAELAIVHAIPAIEAGGAAHYLDAEFSATLAHDAKKRIGQVTASAGIDARVFIEAGAPAKAVYRSAENWDADLLLIGRHAPAGLAGHLRQNAYSILRDSPCPVLSI